MHRSKWVNLISRLRQFKLRQVNAGLANEGLGQRIQGCASCNLIQVRFGRGPILARGHSCRETFVPSASRSFSRSLFWEASHLGVEVFTLKKTRLEGGSALNLLLFCCSSELPSKIFKHVRRPLPFPFRNEGRHRKNNRIQRRFCSTTSRQLNFVL